MKRPFTLCASICAAAAVVLTAASLLTSGEEAKAPAAAPAAAPATGGDGYQLVVPLEALMEVVNGFFSKMPEKLKAGTKDDYKLLKRESLFIAEMGNLVGRLKGHSGEAEWRTAAELMKTQGLAMATAAEKKDTAQFESLHGKTKGVCKTCHDKYRD